AGRKPESGRHGVADLVAVVGGAVKYGDSKGCEAAKGIEFENALRSAGTATHPTRPPGRIISLESPAFGTPVPGFDRIDTGRLHAFLTGHPAGHSAPRPPERLNAPRAVARPRCGPWRRLRPCLQPQAARSWIQSDAFSTAPNQSAVVMPAISAATIACTKWSIGSSRPECNQAMARSTTIARTSHGRVGTKPRNVPVRRPNIPLAAGRGARNSTTRLISVRSTNTRDHSLPAVFKYAQPWPSHHQP